MQKLLEPDNQSFHEYSGQYFYLRIPWKNHGLCQKQFLPQNYDCPFSQLRKMGWFTACKYLKIFCHWDYLFNGIENAVVLLSYPEKAFGNPKALRAFLSTDVSLPTDEILSYYVCRWPIEIFFRQCKDKLALDNYQIHSSKGIQRYWLLMSLAHYICVTETRKSCAFETGYHQISDIIQLEKYWYLFQCAKASNDFESFMKLAV